ncbi:hypothetical protein SeLEV6574_g06442, partial [Synchytrium endobioticum]
MEELLVKRKKPAARRRPKPKTDAIEELLVPSVVQEQSPAPPETMQSTILHASTSTLIKAPGPLCGQLTGPLNYPHLEALRSPEANVGAVSSVYPDINQAHDIISYTTSNSKWTALREDMPVAHALYPPAPAIAQSLIATPTAPPLFTDLLNNMTPNTTTRAKLQALPEAALDTIYINDQMALHPQLVDEFRGQCSNIVSEFASRVREYEQGFIQIQRTKLNLQTLKARTKSAAARMWTLKKDTHTVEATCSDGVSLSHTYASEVAVYSESVAVELTDALTEAREEQYQKLTHWAFQGKLAKLWIQNTIDEFLAQSPLISAGTSTNLIRIFTEGAKPDSNGDYGQLKHYLNVLFYFERRNNGLIPGTWRPESPGRSSTNHNHDRNDNASPVDAELYQDTSHSVLVRDIRGWITHLISALLTISGPLEHKFILLHALRCEGIASWGASFIQWPLPIPFTNVYQDHYFVALSALLGPVEEIEEELEIRNFEDLQVRESLKKLEDSDWVVIDESEAHPNNGSRTVGPIALTEEDYLVLLDQFNFYAVYQLLLQHHINVNTMYGSSSVSDPMEAGFSTSTQLPNPIIKMFASIHVLSNILMRAFSTFPVSQYSHVIKRIGQILVNTSKQTGDALVSLLAQYEEMYGNSRVADDIIIVKGYTTSIQSEMDSFMIRIVKRLLAVGGIGVYQFLSSLPVDYCSASARVIIVNGVLKDSWSRPRTGSSNSSAKTTDAQQQLLALMGESSAPEQILSSSLLHNPNESVHLLTFLTTLALATGDGLRRRVHSVQTATLTMIVQNAIFSTCYLDVENREALSRTGRDLLGTLCSSRPELMSPLLVLVRNHFGEVGGTGLSLFKTLPLKMWRPNVEDLDILQSMLKDPVGSRKFFFAKYVLGALNWGVEDPSNPASELAIPRTLHRFIALAISNIYLDRQSVRDARSSVMAAASTAASAAVRGVATVAPVPSSITSLTTNYDAEFAEWTWAFLVGLQLYQRPSSSSPDVYSLETPSNSTTASIRAGFRPFEPLDSPYLATHRGAIKTSALAAYIVLAVSEIGHRWEVFSKDGWTLLSVLVSCGRAEPILKVASDFFVTFAASRGETVFDDAEFLKFFGNFFKSYTAKGEKADADARQILDQFFRRVGPNNKPPYWQVISDTTDPTILVRFWMRAIFADRDWIYNRSSLRLLDVMCKASFAFGHHQHVQAMLSDEYSRLSNTYSTVASAASKMSPWYPVQSAKAVAEAVYLGYPSLVVGSSSILSRTRAEKRHFWFAVMGLLVETRRETAIRKRIVSAIRQGRNHSEDKPISALSIYKWVRQVLETPIEHPVTPIIWQALFSLYFEKSFDGHLPMTAWGPRYFDDQPDMVHLLERRLSASSQYWSDKSTATRADEVSNRSLPERLIALYNAMSLWLREPVFVSTNHLDLNQFTEVHVVSRLSDVLGGTILEEGGELWIDYVHMDDLRSELKSSFVSAQKATSNTGLKSLPSISTKNRQSSAADAQSAPHVPPVLTLRPPLIQPQSSLNPEVVESSFKGDVATLLEKANAFRDLVASAADGDKEYASHLSQLYIPETKRGRAEKSCISSCQSPAVFEYRYSDVRISSEARALIRDNRARVEALMSIDGVEPKVVVSSLRLGRILEWLLEQGLDHEGLAFSLFYHAIQAFETGADGFPPALFILDRFIKGVGRKFVITNLNETERVFSMLVNPARCAELLDVFNPASTVKGARFVEMYEEIALKQELPDITISMVLGHFNIKIWASKCTRHEHLFMLERLFEILGGSDYTADDTELIQAHRNSLIDLLTVDVALIMEAATRMLQQIMFGKLPPSIVAAVTEAMTKKWPLDHGVLNTNSTVGNRLGRNDLLVLANTLGKETTNCILGLKSRTNLYTTLSSYSNVLSDFLIVIFSSDHLYSIMSDVHLDELGDALRQVWLPLLYIAKEDGDYVSRGSWNATYNEDAKRMQSLMVSLATKIFRNAAASERLPDFLWSIQATAVSAACPITDLLYRELKTVSWSQFKISSSIVGQVLGWHANGRLLLEVQRFLATVISDNPEWTCLSSTSGERMSPGRGSKVLDTVMAFTRMCFILLESSYEAHPAQSNRIALYTSLEVVFNQIPWSNLAPVQYQALIACLPSVWSGGAVASTIMAEETRQFPSLFALKLLRMMTGLELLKADSVGKADMDDLYSKMYQYVEYVLDVVAEAMKSSTIQKTFVPSQFHTIVIELVSFVQSTPAQGSDAQCQVLKQTYQRIFALLNASERSTEVFESLWNGVQALERTSSNPLLLLSTTCATLASVEHMAQLVEICIERYLSINLAESGDVAWAQIGSSLIIPELDAESFTRTCLVNGLALTLHAQAVQRLSQHLLPASFTLASSPRWISEPGRLSVTANATALRTVVATGELVASWIASLRVDAVGQGKDGKMFILLHLFVHLLSAELSCAAGMAPNHSKLVSALPPVADALARWGEDRASSGLWATFGLGAKSRLSVELRLFA